MWSQPIYIYIYDGPTFMTAMCHVRNIPHTVPGVVIILNTIRGGDHQPYKYLFSIRFPKAEGTLNIPEARL
jgi:hypothetical protein